jgi:hypothetical protein
MIYSAMYYKWLVSPNYSKSFSQTKQNFPVKDGGTEILIKQAANQIKNDSKKILREKKKDKRCDTDNVTPQKMYRKVFFDGRRRAHHLRLTGVVIEHRPIDGCAKYKTTTAIGRYLLAGMFGRTLHTA